MPARVEKSGSCWKVKTPNQTHAKCTTKGKAKAQQRLLNAIHYSNWKPTGKPAKEAIQAQARRVVNRLLEVDEVSSLPIPASGKAYARIAGMRGLRNKQQLYIRMARDLGNRGKSTYGFPNRDGAEYTGAKDESLPPLERHRTEKTKFGGGRYGKAVNPAGKTSGKFKFPEQWPVGHAIKY